MRIDTYAVLEFQGIVSDVPSYDTKTGRLDFVARPLDRPSLKFFAQGELAKGFKSMLHKGIMLQIQAIPFPHMEEVGGELCRVIDWEAKAMRKIGYRRINLGKFSDARILDGLLPMSNDLIDVGFVSEYAMERERKLKERASSPQPFELEAIKDDDTDL